MAESKKLKRYFVTITWYPEYASTYDDAFDVWAYNKCEVTKLLSSYYSRFIYNDLYDISIYTRWISTLWFRLFKKVPNKSVIEHL